MESMVDIEFNFNQKIIMIQAKLDEPFQLVIEQYIQKALIKPNSVYFIANSKLIEPKQTVENHMNDIDKQNNKIVVFVNLINKENENKIITYSKDIICPQCKEPCRFTIDNYKIKLFDCAHNHINSNIKLADFYETQRKEITDIVCDSCKNINKGYSNDKDNVFFECLNCKEMLCFQCKSKHDLNHNIIKYYQKNYICTKHNYFFYKYCIDCRSNICFLCDKEHVRHKTTEFSHLKPDIEKSKKKLKEFRTVLDTLTNQIQDIIKKLNQLLEDMNIYYEINKNILQNYEENNINYQTLKNINEFNINNKIYEKIKNIISYTNIKDKIQDILDLYTNIEKNNIKTINEKNKKFQNKETIGKNDDVTTTYGITPMGIEGKLNKISIVYKVEKRKENIKLFGIQFVENNKKKCHIIINGKKRELSEYFISNINEYEKLEVKLIETEPITNMSYMFSECKSLISLPDISKMYTGNITNMSFMFHDCEALKSLPDISNWDTRNVTNMSCMFKTCILLFSLPDISKWNTRNVTNMESMFYECLSLVDLPDISNWDTENVTNMSCLFKKCSILSSLPDISKWDTKRVTDMNSMFYRCCSLNVLPDISKWDIKNVTRIDKMFYFCEELKYLPDISKWDTQNILNMESVFRETKLDSLPDLSKWNTKSVTNMSRLFYNCSTLTSLPDISTWDTSNVIDMCGMFKNCSSLICLPDISKWNINNVNKMEFLFQSCSSLESLPDISKWDTKNVSDMSNMFHGCSNLKSCPDISNWTLKKDIRKEDMFIGVNKNIIPKKFRGCVIY